MLSDVYWRAGRYTEAQALAVQAYARAHETQERGIQAWTARLLGDMHAQGDAPDVGVCVAAEQICSAQHIGSTATQTPYNIKLPIRRTKSPKAEFPRRLSFGSTVF